MIHHFIMFGERSNVFFPTVRLLVRHTQTKVSEGKLTRQNVLRCRVQCSLSANKGPDQKPLTHWIPGSFGCVSVSAL